MGSASAANATPFGAAATAGEPRLAQNPAMTSLEDPRVAKLLDRLHAASEGQNPAIGQFFEQRIREAGALDWKSFDARTEAFMADKFIALERDKAGLAYQLCRALHATRVVECGTSYGVSTIYLAAAVRDNLANGGGRGVVIATEHEAEKAKTARAHWAEAGLADLIELREGDLRETLRELSGPIDFVLMDIWTPMARPALERIAPHLRPGAIVLADNTESFRAGYADYFAFVNEPKNRFRTLTLPYAGGLELTVRVCAPRWSGSRAARSAVRAEPLAHLRDAHALDRDGLLAAGRAGDDRDVALRHAERAGEERHQLLVRGAVQRRRRERQLEPAAVQADHRGLRRARHHVQLHAHRRAAQTDWNRPSAG